MLTTRNVMHKDRPALPTLFIIPSYISPLDLRHCGKLT